MYYICIFLYFLSRRIEGRYVGKLVTRTKVIRDDETEISWEDVFIRSFCRLIPFEAFTGFGGYPLHDRISHTRVIKVKK